jgi:hypothetical protein
MFYISYGCSYLDGTKAWRVPWALQMLPAFGLFFGLFALPESPRWLAKKDRWEEAHDVLARVHAKGDHNAAFVQAELQDIKDMCAFRATEQGRFILGPLQAQYDQPYTYRHVHSDLVPAHW